MKFLHLAFVTGFALCATAGVARADYSVWRDVNTGMSLSFPDTWQMVNNAEPDDVITVMPPSGEGQAVCRVRARDEHRYLIYPPRYSPPIQKIGFSLAFWDGYLGEYSNARIYSYRDTTSLGRGYAGYAMAGYDSKVPGPYMSRKALMFASLYNDTLYIAECAAGAGDFARWKDLFLSVVSSVDFRPAHHQLMTGYYRDFLADPPLYFEGPRGKGVVAY